MFLLLKGTRLSLLKEQQKLCKLSILATYLLLYYMKVLLLSHMMAGVSFHIYYTLEFKYFVCRIFIEAYSNALTVDIH